jgi:Cell wall hydrolyses involved in spore germination
MLVAILLVGTTSTQAFAEEVTTAAPIAADTTVITTETDTAQADAALTGQTENSTIEQADNNSTIEQKPEVKDSVKKEVTKKVSTKKKTAKKYSKSDLRLLSCLIYCEAGGESYSGKLAVGIVVMNRRASRAYPNSVKGVIYQRSQFGPARNGSLNKALREYDAGRFTSKLEKDCIRAAKEALSGTKTITVAGNDKNFSKYLSFSGRLSNPTYKLGHHQFK